VLDVDARLEGDDEHELFLRGETRELFRYPVVTMCVRVGITGPVDRGELAPEVADRAAELLLGVKETPWWKRWWRSEREKMKGWNWRVSH